MFSLGHNNRSVLKYSHFKNIFYVFLILAPKTTYTFLLTNSDVQSNRIIGRIERPRNARKTRFFCSWPWWSRRYLRVNRWKGTLRFRRRKPRTMRNVRIKVISYWRRCRRCGRRGRLCRRGRRWRRRGRRRGRRCRRRGRRWRRRGRRRGRRWRRRGRRWRRRGRRWRRRGRRIRCRRYRRITFVKVNVIVLQSGCGDRFLKKYNSMTMNKLVTKNQLMFDASTGLKSSQLLRIMRMINRDDSPEAHEEIMSAVKFETALQKAVNQVVKKHVRKCPGNNLCLTLHKTRQLTFPSII